MDKMSNMDEMVSALADGELHGEAFALAVDAVAGDADARASWHAYHLVGDVLRSPELAATSNGVDFVARFRARLEHEQAAVTPVPAGLVVHDDARDAAKRLAAGRVPANAPGLGWPLLAGVASLTAMAAIAWNILGGAATTGPASAELAQSAPQPTQQQARVESTRPVMIRDARLDELLAAHRQAGGASALQMPAGFLRNATFESPGR